MTPTTEKKQVEWLKYINTFILSIIAIFTVVSFNMLSTLIKENAKTQTELVRLKTVQDINTNNITVLQSRVGVIESENTANLKEWVDENYVRKAQK